MRNAPTNGARRACNTNKRRTREASPKTTAKNPLPETTTPYLAASVALRDKGDQGGRK